MNIAVVISTYNRSRLLRNCLESVKDFADEIIVIDNSSSDDSVAVAKKYTKHVFIRKNNLMLNVNKNYGFTKASKDWVLYLDDDEQMTDELKQEIKDMLLRESAYDGYLIPRKNIIFNKWIEHTGWYPDYQLRLFRRGKGKFPELHVHELIEVKGEVGTLSQPFIHYNYETVFSFIQKTAVIYAPNEAENMLKKGYQFSFVDAVRMPFEEFLSRYFAREGYKDGFHGLILSLLMASYHLFVFAYIWEKKGFPEESKENIERGLKSEIKKMSKDLRYWIRYEEVRSLSGLKKLAKKILPL